MVTWSFVHISYYLMWLMLLFWSVSLFLFLRENGKFVSNWPAMLLGAGLTLAVISGIFFTVPAGLKIFNDDVRLLSVSKSMYEERRCDGVGAAVRGPEKTEVFRRTLEKRPLLFPFLTHLIHHVRGYHVENPLYVNFIFSWGALFLLFLITKTISGNTVLGVAGMLAGAAHPIFAMSATSGGMETVNLFFALLSAALLYSFLKSPSVSRFGCLVMTLTVGAHARYESPMFLFLILFVLFAAGYLKKDILLRSVAYLSGMLVFLLPVFLQRLIKIKSQEPAWVGEAFNISRVPAHTLLFLKSIFRGDLGVNNVINGLGILACLFFVILLIKNRSNIEKSLRIYIIILLINLVALWVLITAYYSGNVDGRFSARFFMIHGSFFAVLSVLFVDRLLRKLSWRPWVIVAVMGSLALYYHPSAMANIGVRESFYRKDYDAVTAWVKSQPATNAVYIYEFPEHLLVQNFSCLNFSFVRKNRSVVRDRMLKGVIQELRVIQVINNKENKILKKTKLPEYLIAEEEIGRFSKNRSSDFLVRRVRLKDA